MNDIVDIRKPLDILKNALLDSCPGSHLNALEKWFVNLDQRLLDAQTDKANIAYLKSKCAEEINEVIHARRDYREISNIVSVYSFAINEFKKFIKYKSNRIGFFRGIGDFSIQINHYATKSYLEYFCTRRKRGDVNAFANNTSVLAYKYTQEFSVKPDYTIYRFLPFLKVRIEKNIKNYFES